MFNFDFITIGGATEDIAFHVDDSVVVDNKKDITKQKLLAFEYGAKLRTDKAYSTFGGGAANTAVCLSKLGFKVAGLIPVGDDIRGERIVKNLKKNKVDPFLVQRIKGKESPFAFLILGKGNEHVAFVNSGAKNDFKVSDKSLKKLKKAEWLYITSLAKGWQAALGRITSLERPKIAWNPGDVQIRAGLGRLKKYLQNTNVLCVNKDEAIELAISAPKYKNKPRSFLNNIRNLLKILKEYGPEIVVVTRGEEGSGAYDGERFYHQSAKKVKKVADTTGVGDAFNSSFVAGLELYKGDIQKAMQLGMKNSASVVKKQGAQNGLLTKKNL
jgi:fructoselysine 6-kinase